MILYDFAYERPRSLADAASLYRTLGADACLLAGGTDLLPNMRAGNVRPATVISLGGIAAEPPQQSSDGAIRIDALTTLAELVDSELIRREAPIVAEAAHVVGSQQIREMGTLGGNLCQETRCLYLNQKHDYQFRAPCYKRGGDCCYPFPRNTPETCWSVYMSDTAPALIALGAEVETLRENGGRRLSLENLFTGSGLKPSALEPGEIIRAVILPPRPSELGWGYHKSARRGGLEFAMSVMAVTLRLTPGRQTCEATNVVIGAVRERPVRAREAERILVGMPIDDATIAKAAATAVEEIKPLPHHGFSKSYIVDNMRVYLRRTLLRAVQRARGDAAGG